MTLGDDRVIKATYVAGEQVYERTTSGDDFRYPAAA
jgi:guanine deaminase